MTLSHSPCYLMIALHFYVGNLKTNALSIAYANYCVKEAASSVPNTEVVK